MQSNGFVIVELDTRALDRDYTPHNCHSALTAQSIIIIVAKHACFIQNILFLNKFI